MDNNRFYGIFITDGVGAAPTVDGRSVAGRKGLVHEVKRIVVVGTIDLQESEKRVGALSSTGSDDCLRGR
jgi:predicted NBD/HSP70 family sugar kinase